MGAVRKVSYFVLSCGLVACVLMACERPAYAYVDPGSGLFLLQGVSTAFLGLLYALRRKLRLVKDPKKKKQAAIAEELTAAPEPALSELKS